MIGSPSDEMAADPARPAAAARRRVVRAWWLVVGFVAVAVGAIGVVVPGLPTTVFFIIAAWCFSRSSPRFEQWVLQLPNIGPMVADHRAGLGMARRAKRVAITMVWAAITLSVFINRERVVLAAVVVAAGFVATVYISWRVPTRETVLMARAAAQR